MSACTELHAALAAAATDPAAGGIENVDECGDGDDADGKENCVAGAAG